MSTYPGQPMRGTCRFFMGRQETVHFMQSLSHEAQRQCSHGVSSLRSRRGSGCEASTTLNGIDSFRIA